MQPPELSRNSSAGDFLARRLGDEGRASESSRRSGGVDLINEALIERDVYPHGPAGIGQQRDGEQHTLVNIQEMAAGCETPEVPA